MRQSFQDRGWIWKWPGASSARKGLGPLKRLQNRVPRPFKGHALRHFVSQNCQEEGKAFSMPTGVVKWFNEAKGFGFVTPSEGGNDIFAHFSDISGQGFRTLHEGQRIEYDLKDGPKGPQAANIRSLDPVPDRPRPAPTGDRPPRPFGDRPPREGGGGGGGGFGDRPPRQFGDRPPRPYGDRPPRPGGPSGPGGGAGAGGGSGSWGDRPPRTPWGAPVRDSGGGFGAPPAGGGFEDRKAAPRRFNERPKRDYDKGKKNDE